MISSSDNGGRMMGNHYPAELQIHFLEYSSDDAEFRLTGSLNSEVCRFSAVHQGDHTVSV